MVPADAEIVIEGLLDPEYFEPEVHSARATAISIGGIQLYPESHSDHPEENAVFTSIISQVTPSESSVIKRVAYEPLFLNHLRDHLGISGVVRVGMHEPLTNLRKVVVIQVARETARTEIWRALYGAMSFQEPSANT